jgi:hypothetical protein
MLLTLPTLLLSAALVSGGGEPGANNLEKEFYAWSVQSLEVPAAAGQSFQTRVVLDDWFDAELVLDPYSVRAAGFRVLEQGADGQMREVEVGTPVTYRGFVAGIPGSVVSASIIDGQLRARIQLHDGSSVRMIEPLTDFDTAAAKDLHVVYDAADVVPDSGYRLAEPLVPPVAVAPPSQGSSNSGSHQGHDHSDPGALGGGRGARADETCEIAADADIQFYHRGGPQRHRGHLPAGRRHLLRPDHRRHPHQQRVEPLHQQRRRHPAQPVPQRVAVEPGQHPA